MKSNHSFKADGPDGPPLNSNVRCHKLPSIPVPRDFGTFDVEPFIEYRARWPKEYDCIPDDVIET